MKQIEQTEKYTIFLEYFQGMPVRLIQDRETGDIIFNTDDVMEALGTPDSLKEFLKSDEGMAAIARAKEEEPGLLLFGENGFSKVELSRKK